MTPDKCPLLDVPISTDAPPSYDASTSRNTSRTSTPSSSGANTWRSDESSNRPQPYGPTGGIMRAFSGQVKTTITALIHDLVRPHSMSTAPPCREILESCSEACNSRSLNLSSIIQDHNIEGHTSIYWAIINGPRFAEGENQVLTALLQFSQPLEESTVSELRWACLAKSDQPLFQHLQRKLNLNPRSKMDKMILSSDAEYDEVHFLETDPSANKFTVDVHIKQFQKRLVVGTIVYVEFIAKARMWRLQFYNRTKWSGDQSLYANLTLMERSPSTNITATLGIAEQTTRAQQVQRQKPSIHVNMSSYIAPFSGGVQAALPDCLRYEGSSYLMSDGSLYARLEADLSDKKT
ncbi:uncharacterized protein EV420DRAFT_1633578 [Desarmillaria tabescens]|uniref:Uncharacterized protein n=1 Tax=Armillaria tabescens TaxID=1929756 RepID=A0AA39NPF8_ARMTA|nr:uncharacterized protein EV420DRAFT_1633578 [Desarmillaria tabescens]KAK0469148.1 hypothetical protein EV420DRAFT_1633578 [Desarmillaria tabescens]